MNRLGLTGVMDPGGNNLTPADYAAVQEVWRRGEMTVRVAYSLNGQTSGREFDDYKTLLALVPMGSGDGMLRFVGLGERLTDAMNNNPRPSRRRQGAATSRLPAGRRSAATGSPCTGGRMRPSTTC